MLDQRRQAHEHAGCLARPTWPRPGAGGCSESVSSRQLAAEKRATQTGGPAQLVAITQKRSIGMHCNKYQMKEHIIQIQNIYLSITESQL